MTFDSREPGTPATTWDAAGVRSVPELRLDGVDELIVVAAHPDDETLGAGGLIAGALAAGIPVRVLMVTDGGANDAPGTVDRRSAELRAALAVLGGGTVEELGFPDGGVLETRDAVGAALDHALRDAPSSALLVAPWSGDGHRDHRVIGELVAEHAGGRAVASYPIWAWHWGDPAEGTLPAGRMRSYPVDVERKRRAIERYTSQISGTEPMLRADVLEHFLRDREVFILDDPNASDALPATYFDDVYARRDDPWRLGDRWYEARKRDATMAALTRPRYASALEIGSSTGLLTERLADRCDGLLAIDVAASAVAQTRDRLGERARVEQRDAAADFPAGPFDLVVLSEVGYYFGSRLDEVLTAARDALAPDGELVACHWRHPVADYPLSGDDVHARLGGLGLTRLVRHEEADFLLEVWSRDPASVATREGLA